jgi:hypothetical protein
MADEIKPIFPPALSSSVVFLKRVRKIMSREKHQNLF